MENPVEHIDTLLKVTPASMIGYGVAVTTLVIVAYIFYSRWKSADTYIRELERLNINQNLEQMKEAIVNTTLIKERLENISDQLKEIKAHLQK